jgi:hypothetical protein
MSEHVRTEEHVVNSSGLKAKVKELVREGNVRRVIIKNPGGRTVLDLPLTIGLVGAVWLPLWAAIGGIAALAARYTIVIERVEPQPTGGIAPRPH